MLNDIDEEQVDRLIRALLRTIGGKKIFLVGAGRSGLVARAFAMRLMHIGFSVHVLGETLTPPLSRGDLLIVISGSGETIYPVTIAKETKELGGYVAAITSYPESALGEIADLIVRIRGRVPPKEQKSYEARQILGMHEPLTPMGTVFELTSMLFCDSLIAELVSRMGKSEEDLERRHATLQ